ncbi:MAG: glucokinase [Gammaproteobacteria bacterium]
MRLLAADIGGTKTLIQLTRVQGERREVLYERRYASVDFPDFHTLVRQFLQEGGEARQAIDAACLAVAGPVEGDPGGQWARVTNLPWRIDSRHLAAAFHIGRACLINDFAAVAYGISTLGDEELYILQQGAQRPHAPQLVAGAGTGFGLAQRVWDGHGYQVLSSEAGHADFSPATPLQSDLAVYLREKLGRCAIESVLSGPGLVNIYDFLLSHHGSAASAAQQSWLARQDAAAISDAAMEGRDERAREALELFCAVYGATLGNLALFNIPRGGVYIAGGIAPRIIDWLCKDGFLQAFKDKGKMAALMETLPLAVVMNPRVGLHGARLFAEKYC